MSISLDLEAHRLSYNMGLTRAAAIASEQTRLNVQARRDRADDELAREFQGLGDVIFNAIMEERDGS